MRLAPTSAEYANIGLYMYQCSVAAMETQRVNICYRPLRIAWVIRSDDRKAFREAVRLTHTLWGGRFNPIVMADRAEEAKQLIELFRADMIIPVGESEEAKEFPERFPHLDNPFVPEELFLKWENEHTRAQLLDIENALGFWYNTPEWKALDESGVWRFVWDDDDPLADAFLLQYGAYPDAKEIGIDYGEMLSSLAIDCRLDKAAPIPLDVLGRPNLGSLTSRGLDRHHTVRPGWDSAGFFVGGAGNIDDLVCFWNLRAADIQLQFLDPAHIGRYTLIRPEYEKRMRFFLAHLAEHRRSIAIWARAEIIDSALTLFGDQRLNACPIISDPFFWDGGAVRPPMMVLGEVSSMGIVGQERDKLKVAFSLEAKPFCSEPRFYTQRLVASVAIYGSDNQYTFNPPYVPEWNEFFARYMHFHHSLRVEPRRIGIIIDAADDEAFLYGLPVQALMGQLFESIGLRAKLSPGGLITRQLISRLGGVNGARVFRIPGVRRLLKKYGPRDAFTKKCALELIGKKDPQNPQASFADHKHLYIEPREYGTELTPQMVFAHLVEKGIFRIGAELTCAGCDLPSWIALDGLKQEIICELCGTTFDATRQLVNGAFRYRRTGVLGLERNTQGAIPVVLVLHQLELNLRGINRQCICAPSYEVEPNPGVSLPSCEIDFLIVIPRTYPEETEILLGECKDRGGAIDAGDVDNLGHIADALPRHRFKTYIVFAKLGSFTSEEIDLVKTLNRPFEQRVILLTARELEPWHIYERVEKELGIKSYGRSPGELARVTNKIYFVTG
jgi:hypothetical protein